MCGIAGVYNFGSQEKVDQHQIQRMNDLLYHRGPDEEGLYCDGPIGLAMRRLSIIDLSTGKQPIFNESGDVAVIFNGEIYNFKELRPSLEEKGHTFKTNSDTEVIVHLYEEKGLDCFNDLRGMFAIALWDKKNKQLVLARDRFGKKPLLYYIKNGQLAFSSEFKSLLSLPFIKRELNPEGINTFLSLQAIPSPQTAFQSIYKLKPAHLLIIRNGEIQEKKYWTYPHTSPRENIGIEDACENLRTKLKESTKIRMRSDVALGAFLSGGLDSTVIVGLMSELSEKPVHTYSVGFEEQDYSELDYAKEVAEKYNTNHTEIVLKPNKVDVISELVDHFGEPFADSSALPSYFVSRETRKHVTVALSGDGGDENFAGYERYKTYFKGATMDFLPISVRKGFSGLSSLVPFEGQLKSYLRDFLSASSSDRYLRLIEIFHQHSRQSLYTNEFLASCKIELPSKYLASLFHNARHADKINQLLSVDFHGYLPECLMTKTDITSMCHSLEVRSPLLDHTFVEFVANLKGSLKLSPDHAVKWIFKKAFSSYIPDRIKSRKKMGFGIPVHEWFRGPLSFFIDEVILSHKALTRGYFKEVELKRLVHEHRSQTRNHGYRLWALMMLELWHQKFLPEGRVS